jgi:nucleotide-binding universal stress UspA family protein
MLKHILLATDGSPEAARAAKLAIGLAKAARAPITVYHALPPLVPAVAAEGIVIPQNILDDLDAAQRAAGEKLLARVAKAAAASGVPCDRAMDREAPTDGIIAAARRRKCDTIVMGSHGRGALKSLALGSVAQRVLSHSKLPVIVVR